MIENDRIQPLSPRRSRAPVPESPPEIRVEVSSTQSYLRVDESALASLASRCLAVEGVERATVTIAVVDDPTIHRVNRRHLAHDWPTDVVTFGLSDPGDPELAGELVVSAETAYRSGRDPADELSLYVVHGLLHLCGLDDQDPESAAIMRERERSHLAREGISDPYPVEGQAAPSAGGGPRCRA